MDEAAHVRQARLAPTGDHRTSATLRALYTVFLGVLIAIFVGVGINTFYPAPPAPRMPVEFNTYGKEPTAEEVAKQREFDLQMQDYEELMKPYNRNVSIMALTAAVVLLVVGLVVESRIRFVADGVVLGGVLTLIYSLGRGFASGDSKYAFVVVSVALAIVLYLGYHRFLRPRPLTLPAEDEG